MAASVEQSRMPQSQRVELGRRVQLRQQHGGAAKTLDRCLPTERISLISASMACMIGSRAVRGGGSSAAGAVPTESASVSNRCSKSWCILENPCEGKYPASSTVDS
eukprot:5990528-Pleurochrysis_carterae.AAC.2